MPTIRELCDAGQATRQSAVGVMRRPSPERVRGNCPVCGDALVSILYYVEPRGFVRAWECWAGLQTPSFCCYRRIL